MVKKIDNYKVYKKIFIGLIACILAAGVITGIYIGVCKAQHNRMYDKVENAGFKKEMTADFIEKYQGYYALTENDIDYDKVNSLRIEAIQKLKEHRPASIGQASRISGVSPADISVLLVYLGGVYK